MSPIPSPGHLFCFGLGYCAQHLAGRLARAGWRVSGTCRSEAKRQALVAEGVHGFVLDSGRPLADAAAALAGVTHVLVSAPPDGTGDPVLAAHGRDLAAARPAWLGYLSTTGVYGDHGGAWVDEETPVAPTGNRQQARVEAERAWLALHTDHGLTVQIFRLAGIYGPGRSAIDSVRAGTARRIVKAGQVFSRIHVADVANVLLASMARPNPGRLYNLCDDEPAPGHEVIAYACHLLGVEPPPPVPFEQATLSPMAASFYADNRRVHNDRIKTELGVSLLFPTYREGLEAQVANG